MYVQYTEYSQYVCIELYVLYSTRNNASDRSAIERLRQLGQLRCQRSLNISRFENVTHFIHESMITKVPIPLYHPDPMEVLFMRHQLYGKLTNVGFNPLTVVKAICPTAELAASWRI
jgi:hypothetical protein